uniref:Acyl-CoA dehydrogenase/oxidase N-terminal domain-containing protein n=1 Tax=Nymphaea colorata TaxID=210225 RepID=A0A5K1HC61_9MAGN|nr:unnamed protein product [Nymphaea colorata]
MLTRLAATCPKVMLRPTYHAAFKKYDFTDALNFKSLLNEDELIVIDTAHQFAQTHLLPRILEDYREEKFDRSVIKLMGENGLLGCTLTEYGGAGLSEVSYGLINKEIERIDSAYRSAMSVQSSLVIHPINEFATKEAKEKYLPGLIKGELVGCFGLTEPDHGSDPGSMTTRAKLDGNEYVLNGSKMWITNSPIADVFVVWAKDEKETSGGSSWRRA